MGRRGGHRVPCFPVGHRESRRDQVVHQRCPKAVTVLVKGDDLHEGHAHTVCEAAVDLTLDDHRVDAGAAVVDSYEPAHLYLRCAGIHVDHADIRPERIGEVLRVVTDLRLEAPLDALGEI